MKYAEEYLETVVKVKPLGELTTREDILYDMSGEMIYIDGKCSDIFISHADYANWLEKQRQNPAEWHREDEQNLNACLGYIPDEFLRKWLKDIIHIKYDKPADMIEPKFKIGDWVVSSVLGTAHIIDVNDSNEYQLEYIDDKQKFSSIDYVNYEYNEWTIQDAKDGDVLVNGSNIFIFHFINDTRLMGYCHVNTDDGRFYDDIGKNECFCLIDAVVNPATKEQRDLLFQKMNEAGYEWDAEKKELKKIKYRVCDEDKAEMDYCFTKMMNGEKVSEEDEEYNGEDYGIDSLYHAQRILEKTLGSVDGYQTDDGILSHKCAISAVKKLYGQKSAEWGEEDDYNLQCMIAKVTSDIQKGNVGRNNELIDWLKSLKERYTCKPSSELDEVSYQVGIKRVLDNPESYGLTKYNWKPSKGQMEALKNACDKSWEPDGLDPLYMLYEDLKKLKGE